MHPASKGQRSPDSLVLCLLLLGFGPSATAASIETAPIALHPGPHLLIDEFLIEQSSNVVRRIEFPKRDLAQPVVTAKEDHNFQPYVTVVRDAKPGRFRMWYGVPVDAGQSHLAYIESEDGVHWIRPHRVLTDAGPINFGASVLDEGPAYSDAGCRYKYAWYHGGMMLACSADGLQWKPASPKPVITGINDILHLARDTARDRYLAVFGFPSQPSDGYKGKPHHAAEGYRRCVGQSTSADCLHWTKPRRIFAPDDQDEGLTEFYSMSGVIRRGDLLIGVLKVLRDDLPCDPAGPVEGIGYTVLAWSRDGENWQRDRQPFFDRNHAPGTWDHAMAWMDCQLPVGDEVFIYYGGYAHGHKVERFTERQLGLVRIKRDRYVARAAEGEGVLRTRLVTLDAEALALNVDASRGELRAQLLDSEGRPARGFGFADFKPIRTDELAAPGRWKRPVSELKGRLVRVEFALRSAKLYAFELGAKR